jgi:hypothetical protein
VPWDLQIAYTRSGELCIRRQPVDFDMKILCVWLTHFSHYTGEAKATEGSLAKAYIFDDK